MARGIHFNDKDEPLIKKIEAYQRDKELPSFVEAVRQLCRISLKSEEYKKDKK